MTTSNEVPLMFQAQVQSRGQIQYIGNPEQAARWVNEWIEGTVQQMPQFGSNVRTREYKITWRFVCDSGQDEDVIRPVIAGGGFPFYPGASMKGAFLRACTSDQAIRYCGGESTEQNTKPGILRFHGGYPVNSNWREKSLVDVVHPQEDWQVKNHGSHSAFIQISLYQPTLSFGISSKLTLEDPEWDVIWTIWEKALERGIGSRVSAGYGQPIKHPETKLLTVGLRGQGLASQLSDKTGEFRPNMFKAALRGHTLRLFSGITDEKNAEELTKELWGGFAEENGAVVGALGIAFNAIELEMDSYRYGKVNLPTYELIKGSLHLLCLRNLSENERSNFKKLATQIVKFSLLLGGFGKSWRRVDHRLFFPDYTKNNHNPMIGSHWEFTDKSESFYCSVNELSDITNFLNTLRDRSIAGWLKLKGKTPNNAVSNWREAWHPKNVQVWGRFAEDDEDSEAVIWFHDTYNETDSIQGSSLTGQMSQIGRIWHRMYPRYIGGKEDGIKRKKREYVELLTIFPDKSDERTQKFLSFLQTSNIFTKLWGE